MKDLMVRFINEEDGDVVQNVIIIAIFAALALLFGRTVVEFVQGLISKMQEAGSGAESEIDNLIK